MLRQLSWEIKFLIIFVPIVWMVITSLPYFVEGGSDLVEFSNPISLEVDQIDLEANPWLTVPKREV